MLIERAHLLPELAVRERRNVTYSEVTRHYTNIIIVGVGTPCSRTIAVAFHDRGDLIENPEPVLARPVCDALMASQGSEFESPALVTISIQRLISDTTSS